MGVDTGPPARCGGALGGRAWWVRLAIGGEANPPLNLAGIGLMPSRWMGEWGQISVLEIGIAFPYVVKAATPHGCCFRRSSRFRTVRCAARLV